MSAADWKPYDVPGLAGLLAEQPTDSTRSTTAWICSSVAPSFITIIMVFVSLSKKKWEHQRGTASGGSLLLGGAVTAQPDA